VHSHPAAREELLTHVIRRIRGGRA